MAESEFDQLRKEYLRRLRRQLRRVPSALREDAIHEVEAHIEDACRETHGDASALQSVLQRLGPPEVLGRDLGLQLFLQANRSNPSLSLWIWTGLFWASTSIVGAFVIVGSAIIFLFGLAFFIDGLVRLVNPASTLKMIEFNGISFIPAWWPIINLAIGLLIIASLTFTLIFLIRKWSQSKLNQRGLRAILKRETIIFPKGWERRTTLAIIMMALLGFMSCSLFGALGGLFPIGNYGPMSLPQDFFKNLLTFLSFLGGMVFLLSPVLGIVWVAWKEQRKDRLEKDGPSKG